MANYNREHSLYKPKLKERSRTLRKNSTLSETLLWQQLKGRQLLGYKFLRQRPIGNYIVDFFCPELQLAIEIDGFSHNDKIDSDKIRDENLRILNITTVRIHDEMVKKDITNAIQIIVDTISHLVGSHPPNLPQGRN